MVRGGPCQYKEYPGHAVIHGVEESRDGLEIRFFFLPETEVTDQLFQADKAYLLLDPRGRRPEHGFARKKDLQPGSILDCRLRLIVKGACTPVLFDFPGLTW